MEHVLDKTAPETTTGIPSHTRPQGPSREQASADHRQEKLEYAWQLHAQCDAIIPD
jgi:nicotinic acid mononucleotide adenylyltransferase